MLSGIGKRSKYLAHKIWNQHNPTNPYRKGLVVHHIDKNPPNNDISNLKLMSNAEHTRLHHTGKSVSDYAKQKSSERLINKFGKDAIGFGHKVTVEHKKAISKAQKGKILSSETKRKLRDHNIGKPSPKRGIKLSEETKKKISNSLKGNSLLEETIRKMLESRKGYRHSEETKEKIKQSWVLRKERKNKNVS